VDLFQNYRFAGKLMLDFSQRSGFRWLLFVVPVVVSIIPTVCATEPSGRYWADATGEFKIRAYLKKYDSELVTLVKEDGRTIKVARTKLSAVDNRYLTALSTLQQSAEQAVLLEPHLSQIVSKPGAVVEIVEALRKDYPDAIGANLYGAAMYAVIDRGSDSLRQAKSCISSVIKDLQRVEEHFPGRHRRTLSSALNNQAVLSLRQGKTSSAVGNLIKAAGLLEGEIPFAVYHNASLILDSGIDIGGAKSQLAKIIARGVPEQTGQIGDHLVYTLIHDPLTLQGGATSTSDGGQLAENKDLVQIPVGQHLIGSGSGFLIAPNLIITNRHVAEDGTSFVVKNDSGLVEAATVSSISSVADVDLALLKLSKPLPVSPLAIREKDAQLGETTVVLGYPVPELFEASLTVSRGVVSKSLLNGVQLLHDASTDPGNSGGPCVDSQGNVIGVHFAGSTIAKNARNYAVSGQGIKSFLSKIAGYSKVKERVGSGGLEGILKHMKEAVFLIEVYGKQPRSSVVQKPEASDLMEKYALLTERCCIGCGGSGRADCSACIGGLVPEKRRVQVATNVVGEPVYGVKSFKKKCVRCNRGYVSCPYCRGRGVK
jgi:S1-C subfamily serine protease